MCVQCLLVCSRYELLRHEFVASLAICFAIEGSERIFNRREHGVVVCTSKSSVSKLKDGSGFQRMSVLLASRSHPTPCISRMGIFQGIVCRDVRFLCTSGIFRFPHVLPYASVCCRSICPIVVVVLEVVFS